MVDFTKPATDQYIKDPGILYDSVFFNKRKGWTKWQRLFGKALVESFKIDSLIDFGCGTGSFIGGALEGGALEVMGIDIGGSEFITEYCPEEVAAYISYGNVGKMIEAGKWDCVLSIEVAEHLLPSEADIFVDNLVRAARGLIIMTASPKGGFYHLNPQPKRYWIEKFLDRGYLYSEDKLQKLIDIWKPIKYRLIGYIYNNLMVFDK